MTVIPTMKIQMELSIVFQTSPCPHFLTMTVHGVLAAQVEAAVSLDRGLTPEAAQIPSHSTRKEKMKMKLARMQQLMRILSLIEN